MRKLIYGMNLSLDGYIAAPGDDIGWSEPSDELFQWWLDQELAVRAGRYAEDLGLRGYDSVHLATALELGDDEVVVVTWDRDLARATEEVGLGIAGSGGDLP